MSGQCTPGATDCGEASSRLLPRTSAPCPMSANNKKTFKAGNTRKTLIAPITVTTHPERTGSAPRPSSPLGSHQAAQEESATAPARSSAPSHPGAETPRIEQVRPQQRCRQRARVCARPPSPAFPCAAPAWDRAAWGLPHSQDEPTFRPLRQDLSLRQPLCPLCLPSLRHLSPCLLRSLHYCRLPRYFLLLVYSPVTSPTARPEEAASQQAPE
jgi:hypothetical protein